MVWLLSFRGRVVGVIHWKAAFFPLYFLSRYGLSRPACIRERCRAIRPPAVSSAMAMREWAFRLKCSVGGVFPAALARPKAPKISFSSKPISASKVLPLGLR